MLSKGFATVGLLLVSNVFMTLAWYAHLKLQSAKLISNWPLYTVVLFSWAIALLEYSFMVPANRIGFEGNGGPFAHSAQDHSGGHHPDSLHALLRHRLSAASGLEPLRRLRLSGGGRLFRLHEVRAQIGISSTP